MPNQETPRGYELPHPENIASQDVLRIRNAITDIDADVTEVWDQQAQQKLETTLELWS